MQFDSDSIGIYVFGGVVLAGTAVSVIVDMLRKNNDRLWELATELKFRNEAADARIKQLELAGLASAQTTAVAQLSEENAKPIETPAPASQEAPAQQKPLEAIVPVPEDLPGARIQLTPAPEKVEVPLVAASDSAAATLKMEVPKLQDRVERADRPERRKQPREMSPAVAAVADSIGTRTRPVRVVQQPLLEASEAAEAAVTPVAIPAVETEAEAPVLKISAPPVIEEAVPAAAEAVPMGESFKLVFFEPVLALQGLEAGYCVSPTSVCVPCLAANVWVTPYEPEAVEDEFELTQLAELVAYSVTPASLEIAHAPLAVSSVEPETVAGQFETFVPIHSADLLPSVEDPGLPPAEELAIELETVIDPPMVGTMALELAAPAHQQPEPAAPLGIEVPTSLEGSYGPFVPFVDAQPIAVTPPPVTEIVGKKDWSRILGSDPVPLEALTARQKVHYTELPAGFHDVSVLREVAESGAAVTGIVLAIGVESSEPSSRSIVGTFVRSLVQGNDFGCQTDLDEYVLICPPDSRPSSQRKLGAIAEKLWDFQLSSMGTLDLQFSWGGFEARRASVTEAVNGALDQMRETRIERRLAKETRAAVS